MNPATPSPEDAASPPSGDAAEPRGPRASPQAQQVADRLAKLAQGFEQRVQSLPEGVHPSWHAPMRLAAWAPALAQLPQGAFGPRLFNHLCGPVPTLAALADPAGALAMLPAPQALSRLAALALLARPGVLRACVLRAPREALTQALGAAWEPLLALAREVPAVNGDAAAWTPQQWAWLGYAELRREGAWPHDALRRLVRLALPAHASREGIQAAFVGLAGRPTQHRLAALPALFEGRAPW